MSKIKMVRKLTVLAAIALPIVVCADIANPSFGSRERRYERVGHEISRDLLREINKQQRRPRWTSSEIVYLMWASLFVVTSFGAVVVFFCSKRRMRALMIVGSVAMLVACCLAIAGEDVAHLCVAMPNYCVVYEPGICLSSDERNEIRARIGKMRPAFEKRIRDEVNALVEAHRLKPEEDSRGNVEKALKSALVSDDEFWMLCHGIPMDWLLEMAWDCYGVLNRNVGAHIPEYYRKRCSASQNGSSEC